MPVRERLILAAARYGTTTAVLGLLALTACGTARGAAGDRTYAVRPTFEGRDAIARLVRQELAGARVVLDGDATADGGALILDPSQLRRSPQLAVAGGDPIDAGRTERFHLVRTGGRCALIHDRTEHRYELSDSACAPR